MSTITQSLIRFGAKLSARSYALRSSHAQLNRCIICQRYLSSPGDNPNHKKPEAENKVTGESEKIQPKFDDKSEFIGKLLKNQQKTEELDVIEQGFRKVTRIQDVPKHELPVKEIIGEPPQVWWDVQMNRPSIRERIWQGDPIIGPTEKPWGLGKLRKPKRRTVKKAHIETLDEKFVHAYETMGPNKLAYESVVEDFRQSSGLRGWGFIEFQYVAMEYMKAFGVERDVSCYNELLNMYPRGPLRQVNYFSEAMMHGKLEQDQALNLIKEMQNRDIYPDLDTLDIMMDVFGPRSGPVKLILQMWYWIPKLKNINPWLVPDHELPKNPIQIAEILLDRMGDYDQKKEVLCGSLKTADVDPAFLVNSINEEQKEALDNLPAGSAVTVSGPYLQYITRRLSQQYFVLRGEPPKHEVKPRTDEIEFHPDDFEEGYVYAMAITGQPDQSMARLWINELAERHPNLKNLYVTFNINVETGISTICHDSRDTLRDLGIVFKDPSSVLKPLPKPNTDHKGVVNKTDED